MRPRPRHLCRRPYALYLGKLAPNKGTSHLVDVIEQADLDWPLVIAGDGPERAQMEARARQSRKDIRFVGWIDRPATVAWLAHASMLIFTSRGPESLSRVLLEASALGVPIAAMNTGGTPDIVIHGGTGLLSATAVRTGRRRPPACARRGTARSVGVWSCEPRRGDVRLRFGRAANRIAVLERAELQEDGEPVESFTAPVIRSVLRVAVVARSVFPLHGLGGLERHVYDLVRYLADAGVDTTLITRTPKTRHEPDAIHPYVTIKTVPYHTFPGAGRRGTTVIDRSTAYPLFGLRAGREALELVREGRIDIVHGLGASVLGYAATTGAAGRTARAQPAGPRGIWRHESRPGAAEARRLSARCGARSCACARAADRIIATDRALAPVVLQHLHVPEERVRVIPNALDLRALDRLATSADAARARLAAGIGRDDVVLLSVGRIEENKGFHHLAAALGALAAHGGRLPEGRWRWVVIGDGPFRPRLEAAIRDAGLGRARHADRPRRRCDPACVV